MNSILCEDYERVSNIDYIDWDCIKDKTFYITGATGLIGSTLIKTLLYISNKKGLNIRILGSVRNREKAEKVFRGFDLSNTRFYLGDLMEIPSCEENLHYIVHCANPTSSQFFVSHPVETIRTAVEGTTNILELAKEKRVNSFVFLSTMEVYGTPIKGHKISENEAGSFNPAVIRNCYPLSKQLCESLCASYTKEYGVNSKVIRLTQTFGPGVAYNDGRVFAEFARCAIEKRDIILKTSGETERDYLYTSDAITGILTVLLNGKNGEIYTAANENTFCSVYEMASLVAKIYDIQVRVEKQDVSKFGYAETLHMDLDTNKLQALGWKAEIGLEEAYCRLIGSLADCTN